MYVRTHETGISRDTQFKAPPIKGLATAPALGMLTRMPELRPIEINVHQVKEAGFEMKELNRT